MELVLSGRSRAFCSNVRCHVYSLLKYFTVRPKKRSAFDASIIYEGSTEAHISEPAKRERINMASKKLC
jgi:hypothetical protein